MEYYCYYDICSLVLNPAFHFFFLFSFLVSFCIFSYCLFRRLNLNPCWCKCEICQTFVTGQWRENYTNLADWYTSLLKDSPTKTVHIHVLNNTITANPKNVEHILRTKFDNYPKGKHFSTILGDLLGKGIFIVDGEHWRFQRKLASLELGSNSIRAYAHEVLTLHMRVSLLPSLATSSIHYSPSISPAGGIVNLQDVFREFTFGNICRFSFGIDPSGLVGLGLAEAFEVASGISAERALQPSSFMWQTKRLLNVGSERRLRAAIVKVNVLADYIMKERRKKGFATKNDLLSRFMGSVTDDKYLRDIVVSFLLAGRDTVSSGLTVLFYLLARHPEVEARIIKESNRVLGELKDNDDDHACSIPSLEQLGEMHYLHGTLYESLRLFPPIQNDSKWAQDDDILPDGTQIKKGTRVSYHPYAMGRMEEIWSSDSLQFKPERWLTKDGHFRPESPYKYPVFQAGVRVCLGKDIALLTMKTVALTLIRRFEIRLADQGWTPRFIPGLTATIKGGLPVVITDRSLRK